MSLQVVSSSDGSNTAFSTMFQEHYHSTNDGALNETFEKHITPVFELLKNSEELVILDICFGLGYNTLATLYFRDRYFPEKKVTIYSPEFDKELVSSLETFEYPEIFQEYKKVINEVSKNNFYEDKNTKIELYIGDAREYLKVLQKREVNCNVLYQDAFSPSTNPLLWTQEYFDDVTKLLSYEAVVTTYSIALKVRLALHNCGFNLYTLDHETLRISSIAAKQNLNLKKVDMEHKIACNREVEALRD